RRLSKEQARILNEAAQRHEQVAISAMTLREIAILFDSGARPIKVTLNEIFSELEVSPFFRILPLTIEIAREFSLLGALQDPTDRVIVATARVHGLRLLTSDLRIIQSN